MGAAVVAHATRAADPVTPRPNSATQLRAPNLRPSSASKLRAPTNSESKLRAEATRRNSAPKLRTETPRLRNAAAFGVLPCQGPGGLGDGGGGVGERPGRAELHR